MNILPAHIAPLVSELEELATLENLHLINTDNLRRRLKDAAKWLRLLSVPSQFRPLDQPDFTVPTVETFYDYHPERWGQPVQFARLRELDRAWAVARPSMAPDVTRQTINGPVPMRGFVVTWHASFDDAVAGERCLAEEADAPRLSVQMQQCGQR